MSETPSHDGTSYFSNRYELEEEKVVPEAAPTQGSWEEHAIQIGRVASDMQLKEKIPFRYGSTERRNVSKYIMRFILRNFNRPYLLSRYLAQGLDLISQPELMAKLEEAKQLERKKNPQRKKEGAAKKPRHKKRPGEKKDYIKAIRQMLQFPIQRTIMRCGLEHLVDQFRQGKYGSIREDNRDVYQTTVEDYCAYVADLDERLKREPDQNDS